MSANDSESAGERPSDSARLPGASGSEVGLHRWKRAGIAALGGGLLAYGLRRRSLGGTAIAAVGGWLSYRALGGRSSLSRSTESRTITRTITIGKPGEDLSDMLHDAETLDRIAGRVAEVRQPDEDRHRWTVTGPLEGRPSWEMRIAEESPGERLRWESVDDTAILDEWTVSFRPEPGDRGTILTLEVGVDPPGGTVGERAIERLDVVPESLVGVALDRFKSLAETGEIQTPEGNPSARGRGDLV